MTILPAFSLPIRRKYRFSLGALKTFSLAILGTVVEYYDYTLYGFCASILAEQFFPTDDPTVALLKTFGVFLMGSLSKPLGALIFGYIGDRFGRSVSLRITMIGIALPTTLIGLMPTYQQIGWIAPCLLLMCRILQGIFASGESDGARIFIFESFFKDRPCFSSHLSGLACFLGIYLASLASSWVISSNEAAVWWRIPFLAAGVLGALVFWARFYLTESPEFIKHLNLKIVDLNMQAENGAKTALSSSRGLLTALLNNKRIVLTAILFCGASGGTYHFYLVFLGKYLSNTLNIVDPKTASAWTSQAVLIYIVSVLFASLLADRFGLMRILKISFYFLLAATLLNIVSVAKAAMSLWIILATAGILASFQAPMITLLLQKIRVSERYRCLSFGHAVGSMLFSGSAPLVSLWLWHTTQVASAPFFYFIILTIMGFLGIFLLQNAKES